MEDYHIGKEIKKEVLKQYPTIEAFAKAIHRERQTVYDIFKRPHIATDRLLEISRLLGRDFFREISAAYLHSEDYAEEEAGSVSESVSLLMPEDELQAIAVGRLKDVADEYLLTKRTQPLVVLYSDGAPVGPAFKDVETDIFGRGMVKRIALKPADVFVFESSIARLTDMPQQVIEIDYQGDGAEEAYDDIILLAEKLCNMSEKHVVLFCHITNKLSRTADGSLDYCDWAENYFASWHKRVHLFVADNEQNDFARRRELYAASCGQGYIDRALDYLDGGNKKAGAAMLKDVLFLLSPFTFEMHRIGDRTTRYHVRSLLPTPEESALLADCNLTPRLSMWFDIDHDTADYTAWGELEEPAPKNFRHSKANFYELIAKGSFK